MPDLNPAIETLFQSKSQILDLVRRADDYELTQKLINHFKNLKEERKPFYLSKDDLEEILKWKLRRQFYRQEKFRERNTDNNIKYITLAAFSIAHENEKYETELRLKLLITLSGVEIPVASAILTLCFPNLYSVIDVRNWRQFYLITKDKTSYTIKEYIDYLERIRKLAIQFEVTPQEIDLAIWQHDIEQGRKASNKI